MSCCFQHHHHHHLVVSSTARQASLLQARWFLWCHCVVSIRLSFSICVCSLLNGTLLLCNNCRRLSYLAPKKILSCFLFALTCCVIGNSAPIQGYIALYCRFYHMHCPCETEMSEPYPSLIADIQLACVSDTISFTLPFNVSAVR